MIVRMWHGRVPTAKAKAYREFTIARAIPDYQSVDQDSFEEALLELCFYVWNRWVKVFQNL